MNLINNSFLRLLILIRIDPEYVLLFLLLSKSLICFKVEGILSLDLLSLEDLLIALLVLDFKFLFASTPSIAFDFLESSKVLNNFTSLRLLPSFK